MSPKEAKSLIQLLASFNAIGLGEGDLNAGANTLAAMAIALANISRPGRGIQSPGFGRMRCGISLLVTGGLSSSLITDDVVTEIALRQNNLTAQLRRLIEDKLADAHGKGLKAVEFPSGPRTNGAENALFTLQQKDPILLGTIAEEWAEVVASPPNPRIEDLAARPKVIVTATRASELEKQLCGLHDGHPLVILRLNRPSDVAALGETCTAVMDGLLPAGNSGESARGNLLIMDPTSLLAEVAKKVDNRAAWLGGLLWLVDGNAGPEVPNKSAGDGKIVPTKMTERFGTVLSRVFGGRLNNHDPGTVVHDFDLSAAQIRWVAFLKNREDTLPGISGTARSLLTTLTFGLLELGKAKDLTRLKVPSMILINSGEAEADPIDEFIRGLVYDEEATLELLLLHQVETVQGLFTEIEGEAEVLPVAAHDADVTGFPGLRMLDLDHLDLRHPFPRGEFVKLVGKIEERGIGHGPE